MIGWRESRLVLSRSGPASSPSNVKPTVSRVATLLRLSDTVVFAFDGDEAGRTAARRALHATLAVIPDTKRVSFALLPQGEDPDSLIRAFGAAPFETELGRALSLSQGFLKSLC